MDITLDELLNGKATRIKERVYFPTREYVEPFLETMSKFTSDFRVQVKLPEQITRTITGEYNTDDVTYNRVLIEAVMPDEYAWDNHDEVIGFLYGLDTRKPVVKMYRGGLNRACTNLCVFDPSFIAIQDLEPEKAINYKPVKNLMEQTSDLKLWLKTLHESEWERTVPAMEANYGKWMRNAMLQSCNMGYGTVKLGTKEVIDAFKSLFIDTKSKYYVKEDEDVNMFNVYNAFTDLISNDGGKDIINKAEKTLLLRTILDF